MVDSDRANEARNVADYAQTLLPGDERPYPLDDQFHGMETEIIRGALAVLKSDNEMRITLSSDVVGVIWIKA